MYGLPVPVLYDLSKTWTKRNISVCVPLPLHSLEWERSTEAEMEGSLASWPRHGLVVAIVLFYMPIPGLVVCLNFKILCMDYQSQFCMILVRHILDGIFPSVFRYLSTVWSGSVVPKLEWRAV